MTIVELMAKWYQEDSQKVFDREAAEPDFLAAKDYTSCEDRIEAAHRIASVRVIRGYALKAAWHAKKEHGENVDAEIETLTAVMTVEDVKAVAEARGWGPD